MKTVLRILLKILGTVAVCGLGWAVLNMAVFLMAIPNVIAEVLSIAVSIAALWLWCVAMAMIWTLDGDGRYLLGDNSGKSLTAIAAAKLLGGRTVILTSTKALQKQYEDDFTTQFTMPSSAGEGKQPKEGIE